MQRLLTSPTSPPAFVPYWPARRVRIDPIAVPLSRWAFVTAPLAVTESLVRYVTYPMAFAALSFRTIGNRLLCFPHLGSGHQSSPTYQQSVSARCLHNVYWTRT